MSTPSAAGPPASVPAHARPSAASAHVQAALRSSPLHMQLLQMLSSSSQTPAIAEEATKVQRMLHRIFPEVDKKPEEAQAKMQQAEGQGQGQTPVAAQSDAQQKQAPQEEAAGAEDEEDDAEAEETPAAAAAGSAATAASTAAGSGDGKKKKKKKKKKSAAGASSAPSSSAAASDSAAQWTPAVLSGLASSSNAEDLLLLALLLDPCSPHLHLRDPPRALQMYGLAAVKMPSAYACARLAHFYVKGGDLVKGAKFLRLGAARGHAVCAYQLGYLLEEGEIDGRPQVAQAVEFYSKAAELRYPQAMFNLATILLAPDDTHPGVEQDIVRGIRLMEDAAALGDSHAQLKLGHLCFLGDAGLEIDASIPRCLHYLTLAAHNESDPSVDAAKVLGIIYSTADTDTYHNEHYDLERAIQYLQIAAEAGDANSRILLAQQLQLAKAKKSEQVLAPESEHEKAMRLLRLQEGLPLGAPLNAAPPAAAAAVSGLSTPSPESLLLALTRLHARFPELGAARLHAKLKAEYPHWAASEKRVRRVVQEQQWRAEDAASAASEASDAPAVSPGSEVLPDGTTVVGRQRMGQVVNDLD